MNSKKLAKQLTRRTKALQPGEPYLSCGSTLINLACSGKANGGFPAGAYIFLVGDSASGKTFLALTALAEASLQDAFNGYRFVYDGPEGGDQMDIGKFFGPILANRLERESPSSTLEDFYYHVDDLLNGDKPFIYILDSMDSLAAQDEQEHFAETKKAHRNGKVATGSYGVAKAKANSNNLRLLMSRLRASRSILIVISQTRDNLGFGFEKRTRSGGRSLRFYADLELWTSIKGKIRKNVNGKDRSLGIWMKVEIKKNRRTGRDEPVDVPIYWASGLDDTGACVRWLIDEGKWSKNAAGKVECPDFDFVGSEEALVRKLEKDGAEAELKLIVAETWREIEAACQLPRKRKYG